MPPANFCVHCTDYHLPSPCTDFPWASLGEDIVQRPGFRWVRGMTVRSAGAEWMCYGSAPNGQPSLQYRGLPAQHPKTTSVAWVFCRPIPDLTDEATRAVLVSLGCCTMPELP